MSVDLVSDGGMLDEPGRQTHSASFLRRHRALLILVALPVVLALVVGGWLWRINGDIAGIQRFEAHLDRPDRPESVEVKDGSPINVVIAGVDDGKGTDLEDALGADTWPAGAFRSDTIMVLHLNANRTEGQLVSIPRDSYVDVPGHGTDKINASFSYGGPALLARTLEDLTGVRMDHSVVLDWNGFDGITDAVGGVDVADEDGQDIHLEGEAALEYVRERKSLPRGDFDRIERQQNFVRAIFKKLSSAGVLRNPLEITSLAGTLDEFLAVDSSLDNGRIRSLALQHRGLRPGDLSFVTVPTLGTDTVDGASIVRLDRPATRDLFDAVAHDEYLAWQEANDAVDELPEEQDVD
ncbi:LCP family protein [Nocardioides panacisoli]|uniref:LCP family protein n=1 Tax=Nocardioides panacisoli TaxID=627624 RepID=UPI001C624BB1|nr:LCP family protein [Nocardioides panacisoli]QYJ03960.1 LCP family protein [Nocardioides panacisoli]